MNINHRSITETEEVEKFYSEKDGVSVKFVCTSALSEYSDNCYDIFYRDSPHPEFGNKYFGLRLHTDGKLYIGNADIIEDLSFGMIENNGIFYYSRYRHDFYEIPDSNYFIDGGRFYIRCGGNPLPKISYFKVKNGEFENDIRKDDGSID